MTYQARDLSWKDAQPLRIAARKPVPSTTRRARGRVANLSGAMAEEAVARHVEAKGMVVAARRWRGVAGEIDLICRDGTCLVFVEVKQASSHVEAARRLGRSQMDRLCSAACEYCAALPTGLQTEMRFDVALVDSVGRVDILVNAFAEA